MCTTLGLETVAEGIENETQVASLLDLDRVEYRNPVDLTATGRFKAADLWPISVAG